MTGERRVIGPRNSPAGLAAVVDVDEEVSRAERGHLLLREVRKRAAEEVWCPTRWQRCATLHGTRQQSVMKTELARRGAHLARPDLYTGDGAGRVLHADRPEEAPGEVGALSPATESGAHEGSQEAPCSGRCRLQGRHLTRAEVGTERDRHGRCAGTGLRGRLGHDGDGRAGGKQRDQSRCTDPQMKCLACHSRGCYSATVAADDVNLA